MPGTEANHRTPDSDADGRPLLLRGARVVLPESVREDVSVLVAGGRIAGIFEDGGQGSAPDAEVLDLSGLTLYPGFIDLHIHGAVGVDTMEAAADDLRRVARFLAAEGVTGWLPTLVPAPDEDYRRAVASVEQLMREQEEAERSPAARGRNAAGARALGVHYEGPFVNAAQCGALRTQYFRAFTDASRLDTLPTLRAADAAHMMTLAPEVEGGVELVRELAARGWVASVGHTRADADTLERARAAGARHMTHFLNAMSPLHHRAPGPVGWGLVNDDVTCDLIADGVHSDPLMLRLVLRCKGPSRVALISDAVAPAGLGDGRYRVWGETIRVEAGRTSNERGSIAGSVITMRDAVRMMTALGVSPPDIARMASLNPARLLGLEDLRGSVETGKRADLVALDDQSRPRLTLVAGRPAAEG